MGNGHSRSRVGRTRSDQNSLHSGSYCAQYVVTRRIADVNGFGGLRAQTLEQVRENTGFWLVNPDFSSYHDFIEVVLEAALVNPLSLLWSVVSIGEQAQLVMGAQRAQQLVSTLERGTGCYHPRSVALEMLRLPFGVQSLESALEPLQVHLERVFQALPHPFMKSHNFFDRDFDELLE